jgi:hypothetical protein
MKVQTKLAALTATLALGAAPALALGQPSHPIPNNTGTTHTPTGKGNQGTSHKPSTPGPSASEPTKAKDFGKDCQGESKRHVAGTPGTPFSDCVTDLAKLANGSVKNPRTACKNESKKHIAGKRGTPFSLCISAAAKLHKK